MTLAQQFAAYSEWRSQLSAGLDTYRVLACRQRPVRRSGRLAHRAVARKNCREDRLNVAFVAGPSRESGRSTPSSLLNMATACCLQPPVERRCVRPNSFMMKTGAMHRSATDRNARFKRQPFEFAFPTNGTRWRSTSSQRIRCRQRFAPSAKSSGFPPKSPNGMALPAMASRPSLHRRRRPGRNPRWRHAIINFPHALLRQGLVILDTPDSTPSARNRN